MMLKDMGLQEQRMVREHEGMEQVQRVQSGKFRAYLVNRYGSAIAPFVDDLQNEFAEVAHGMMAIWCMPWEDYLGEDFADATWADFLASKSSSGGEVVSMDGRAA